MHEYYQNSHKMISAHNFLPVMLRWLDPWSDFSNPCWPVCTAPPVSLVSLALRQTLPDHDVSESVYTCHCVTVSGLVSACEPSQADQIQILDHTIIVNYVSDGLGGDSALCHSTCQAVKLSLWQIAWGLMPDSSWNDQLSETEQITTEIRDGWNP